MKKYLFLLLTFFSVSAVAQNQIYSLITITNNPAINETLDIGSDVRTWKATVSDPTIEVARGASIGASFTNLVLHLRKYPFANISTIPLPNSTNAVRFFARAGDSLSVTIVTNWASRSYITNIIKGITRDHVVVDDLAAMQLLDPSLYKSVTIQYHTTLGDGGGGRFYASNESLTDDGGTIIASEHASGSGWYWVRDYLGPVYTEWWGADGTDSADDTAAFNEAISNFKEINFLPNRTYKIDGVLAASNYKLRGGSGRYGGTTKIQSASTNVYAITIGDNSTAITGIEISGIHFHGGQTNNFGLRIRGNVNGATIEECYFDRFKGTALYVSGESNPIKNVFVSDCGFVQGSEGDLDYIRVIQSSSDNVSGITFTGCTGESGDANDLIDVDSVAVEMLACRWDVGGGGSRVRLSKSQTTNPTITGKTQTTTTGTFTNPVEHIDFVQMGGIAGDSSSGAKAINDAIWLYCVAKAKADSGGKIYFPPGTFYFDTQLEMQDSDGVTISGAGKNVTRLTGFATGQNGIYLKNAKNTRLFDLGVDGVTSASPPTTENHGIRLEGGCDNSVIERVRAYNNDDANIRIGYHNGSTNLITSPNVVVRNCEAIDSPYGCGVEVIFNEDCWVTQNKISGNATHGVRVSGTVRTYVTENFIRTSATHGVSIQGGVDTFTDWHRPQNIYVTNNYLEDNVTGICLFNQALDVTITGNEIKRTSFGANVYGILFNSGTDICAENVIVSVNRISGYARCIYLNASSNILSDIFIHRNTLLDFGATSGSAAGVWFNGNAAHTGIYVEDNLIKSEIATGGGVTVYGVVMGTAGTNLFALRNKIYLDSPTAYVSNTSSAVTEFNSVETNVTGAY